MMFSQSITTKEQFRQSQNQMNERLYVNEERINELSYSTVDLENNLNQESVEKEAYEDLLLKIITNEENDLSVLREMAYTYEVGYIDDNLTYKLPINNTIYTESDEITFYAEVSKPNRVPNTDIDYVFQNNNITPLYRHISYVLNTSGRLNDDRVEYLFNVSEEEIRFRVSPLFVSLFELDHETIWIKKLNRTDYLMGSEYFPTANVTKLVRGGLLSISPGEVNLRSIDQSVYDSSQEPLHSEEYIITDSKVDIFSESGQIHHYTIGDSVVYESVTFESLSRPVNYTILPKYIIEGYAWSDHAFDYKIKNIDEILEVDGKNYECLVVSQYDRGEHICDHYYGKDIGWLLTTLSDGYEVYVDEIKNNR